jgi:dipeptidyl aminopeptidase/acylaminoacyl peptidase
MIPLSPLLLLLAAAQPVPALPDTDILLYAMEATAAGVEIGLGRNITASAGYDNQPAFAADGGSLLFSARRDGRQNDIYRFDLHSDATRRLTRSPKNEYSPRETPDGRYVTVVWEDDGRRQEIWRYPARGGRAETVLALPDLIGYYTFPSPGVVFAFILGEPGRLERIDVTTRERRVIATGIGRCLAVAPDGAVTYVRPEGPQQVLHRVHADGSGDAALFPLPDGSGGDFAWLPDGSGVLATAGASIHHRALGADGWRLVATLPEAGSLSRLAVSPDGRRLAVVASPR